MVSVSTPHLAEDWWASREHHDGTFVAESQLELPASPTPKDHLTLASEQYIRDFLEQARKVQNIAERHLGGQAKSAIVVISPSWKREMARAALGFITEGGHPKQFVPVLAQMPMAQGERKGEMMTFWGKKMLPQVFKWDDASREVIVSELDEQQVLQHASKFIASDLNLESVTVVVGESDSDTTERAGSAMPLSPAIVYS
jgi:hypothetical protein